MVESVRPSVNDPSVLLLLRALWLIGGIEASTKIHGQMELRLPDYVNPTQTVYEKSNIRIRSYLRARRVF